MAKFKKNCLFDFHILSKMKAHPFDTKNYNGASMKSPFAPNFLAILIYSQLFVSIYINFKAFNKKMAFLGGWRKYFMVHRMLFQIKGSPF